MLAGSIVGVVLKCSGAVVAGKQSSPSGSYGLTLISAEALQCNVPNLWLGS